MKVVPRIGRADYWWFGNPTKPSFKIISNLTASNPNIYQATWEHLFEDDPLRISFGPTHREIHPESGN